MEYQDRIRSKCSSRALLSIINIYYTCISNHLITSLGPTAGKQVDNLPTLDEQV
jgi:hypothetical protein